jgi:hypothetical protein
MALISKDAQLFAASAEITPCIDLELADFACADVEVTSLHSVGKDFIPGLADPKKMTAKVLYTAANFAALAALRASVITWSGKFSDGHGFSFTGYLNSIKAKLEPDKAITLEIEVKVSGDLSIL